MPRLTAAERDALPAGDFGLPEERECPMLGKSRAIDAKADLAIAAADGI